ncbi:hypothetical protein B0T42_07360 [Rathayibacter sp. VKM Ac-2630]|nr:hypothetical protein B0T42_07360 [Rathayibacter sp. VKM Ac-2630]
MTVDQRFDAKYAHGAPDECWEWTAGRTIDGYGRFRLDQQHRMIASRFALVRAAGEPSSSMERACHTCDNPPCVNPAHLYWGTEQQNVQDAIDRGRKAKGATHGRAKLTDADVLSIRAAVTAGRMLKDLADEFGVSAPTISNIVAGRIWRHLLARTN